MSVLCCRIPDLLVGLAQRQQPELAGRPLALLGPDECVWAASDEAQQGGVSLQMPARQARMRCPDALLRPLDLEACQSEQSVFVGTLAQCGLPVEVPTWGLGYVDLHALGSTSQSVQPICAEMGKQVRGLFGEPLIPSLGWDTGKFTARAAASYARPGHMRLVDQANEVRFLNPLPIILLPLSSETRQQLDWLGIRTLGQFARLPTTAVWQRFGAVGKVAQRWAQGRDDRPVISTAKLLPPSRSIDFDPPTALHSTVLEAALSILLPELSALTNRLEGLRRVHLDLRFAEDSQRTIECHFIEPVGQESRLRATLSHRLQILVWPAELSTLKITILECGELVPQQLTFFETDEERLPLDQPAQKLAGRYGDIFFHAEIADERHPLPERRSLLHSLSGSLVA